MKKLPKQIKEFLEFVAPDTQDKLIKEYKQDLKKQLPEVKWDQYMLEYWAWRIAFLGNWPDCQGFTLDFSDPMDPTTIIVTLKPDYGS